MYVSHSQLQPCKSRSYFTDALFLFFQEGLYDEALSSFFRNVDSRYLPNIVDESIHTVGFITCFIVLLHSKCDGRGCAVGGNIQHLKARVGPSINIHMALTNVSLTIKCSVLC